MDNTKQVGLYCTACKETKYMKCEMTFELLVWLKLCGFITGIYMYFVRYSKTPRTQTLGAHAEFCEVNIRSPSLFYLYYCRQISTMLIVFWGIIKINTGFNIRPCD